MWTSNNRAAWAIGLSLLVWGLFGARADGPVNPGAKLDLSTYAKTTDLTALQSTIMAAMPTPFTGVPLGPNGAGVTASNNQFIPSDAAQRQGVMRTTLLTDASGNWSVTWANSFAFVSTTPTVVVEAGNPAGSNTITCNWRTRTQTGASGFCLQTATAAISLLGITITVAPTTPATGTPISVIMAEPTQ